MEKFTRGIKGSISLFLSMVMLLLVILEGFLIDGSKVLASKAFLSAAGDLTLNAGLTYYDEALRDIYGLFACCKTEAELTNALVEHFKATIGESVDGNEDGNYTQQLVDYVKQTISSGWNEEETGKLLALTLVPDSFSVSGVENSALSESYVIKSQILEYMKYRGPASLGYGMLEKIHAFKDIDKQQKVLDGKLNYEESMSDVQTKCEEAYTNIKAYNDLLDGALKPSELENQSQTINKEIWETVLAVWCYSVAKKDAGIEENWRKKTNTSSNDVLSAISDCRLTAQMSQLYRQVEDGCKDAFSEHPQATMRAVKILIGYKEDYEHYRDVYTVWENYEDYYQKERDALESDLAKADETEGDGIQSDLDDLEAEHNDYSNRYQDFADEVDAYATVMTLVQDTLKTDIDTRMNDVISGIAQIEKDAANLISLADLSTSALEGIVTEMQELKKKGETWQTSIDNLSEGEVKSSMQADYDNKAKELDQAKIIQLEGLLANGRAYGVKIQNAAKAAKAVDYILYNGAKTTSYAPYLKAKFEKTSYKNETNPYTGDSFADFSVAYWVGNANATQALTDANCTEYFVNPDKEKTLGKIPLMDLSNYSSQMEDAISTKKDEFYQYLERICPKSDSSSASEASQTDAKGAKENLLEQAKKVSLKPEETLPSLSSGSEDKNIPKFTQTEKEAGDKTVSKNAKANAKASGNFLSGISSLLTSGRDKLYISQYATEMFSYYTIDKPENADGSPSEVKETLSGYPITADHNTLYKAEVEYILWGNPSGEKDVSYTLTTIFGIRFLLNTLYAFTGDPEIRSVSLALATSIAGWTGFGVPLVQSVITMAFALAETSLDIQALKKGESVPIYKSTSTWLIKPSGISKQAIGQAINDAASAAQKFIYDELDELTENTKDAFKNKLTTFSEDTVENLVGTATATVLNPLQERIVGLVNVVSTDSVDIKSQLEQALDGVAASIPTADGGKEISILNQLKKQAIQLFRDQMLDDLVREITSVQNSSTKTGAQITAQITAKFETYKSDLKSGLSSTANHLVGQACDTVNTAIDGANENLQEVASEALDQMLVRIDCGVSFADLGSSAGKDVVEIGDRSSTSAALTMDYKEYLWLFIAVKSVANEEAMLERIGTLIEANLAKSKTKPSENFKLDQAYTFLEMKADAKIKTTFLSMPVPLQGGGEVILGQDSYQIHYRSVLGY